MLVKSVWSGSIAVTKSVMSSFLPTTVKERTAVSLSANVLYLFQKL
nr:MAG TPA: hypothetical protein [Caudoviricetes sp.]